MRYGSVTGRQSSTPQRSRPMLQRCNSEKLPVVSTRLQRELSGTEEPRKPTAIDAFKLARHRFQAAERIDMSAMADELGVNRVTLYRWVGSREQLLVEVIWSLGS